MSARTIYSRIALGAIFFMPQVLLANVAYTISPLIIDVEAKARDIITKEITIENIGDTPTSIYPTVNNISLQEGGTIEAFLPPVSSDRTASLASWIEIRRRGIDLKAGESITIPLTLRLHPSPVPGTYHAFIGFGYGRNQDEAALKVSNGRAPGTVITVTIKDEKKVFMKLTRFIVDRFVTRTENKAAVYTFNNPGDEYVVPEGEIILYDNTGKEVAAVPVNAEKIQIPPGKEYTFSAAMPTKGFFGKYKAFLTVEYGTENRASVQDTSYFYIFPMTMLLSVFGILILVVIVSAWYIHRKYFDADIDDSEQLLLHIRPTSSVAMDHDIDLKQK